MQSVVRQQVLVVEDVPRHAQQSGAIVASKAHKIISLVELGIIVIAIALESVSLGYGYSVAFTGFWFAFALFWPALFGCLAACKQSKCCAITCLVMAILCSCVSCVAITFYSFEYRFLRYFPGDRYLSMKAIAAIILAITGFIVTVAQAMFCCNDVCACCNKGHPGTVHVLPGTVPETVQMQGQPPPPPGNVNYVQLPQPGISYPVQQFQAYAYPAPSYMPSTQIAMNPAGQIYPPVYQMHPGQPAYQPAMQQWQTVDRQNQMEQNYASPPPPYQPKQE